MQKQVPRIKPVQRPDKRYLLFELESSERIGFKELSEGMWRAIVSCIGREDALALGFRLVKFQGKKGIVKCVREKCGKTKTVLSKIRVIGKTRVKLKTLKTSGTIKTLKPKL
ncbi:MAG: hypothetical protein JW772_02940 [Candidatus Diapherotrites archaeon]|nr:hypothetical protein [Candidatus Diapherotrites archaeon]